MENAVIKSLKERRSVRSFLDKQVDEEALKIILETATYTPTARNLQSPIIVAVQDKEEIETLRKMNASVMGNPDADPFYGAPTVVIVLYGKEYANGIYDGSLVMGTLMNAAFALGVDSCWIHRAREEFESEEGKALLKKWGIEGEYVGVGHCILGYRDGELPKARERKANYIYRV